ncbi:HAF family repeat protein [Opitutaceae bacterium TAV1]|nr:HAF family repeat protein [Opitutaceae bacterium TAV1]
MTHTMTHTKPTRTGLRALARGLLALGAFAAAALPGSAASLIQDIAEVNDVPYSNDSGQMAYTRWYGGDENPYQEAFLWDSVGGGFGLGTLGGSYSMAYGINNNGWVVGESADGSNVYNYGKAFVWIPDNPNGTTSSAGMTSLGTLRPGDNNASSYAYAINDNGQVVGSTSTADSAYSRQAFVWTEAAGMQQIVTGWDTSEARVINSSGQVAGTMSNSAYGSGDGVASTHLFLWTDDAGGGTTRDLGLLFSDEDPSDNVSYYGDVMGITESGLIVGTRNTTTTTYIPGEDGSGGDYFHEYDDSAFIWKEGEGIQDFLLPGTDGQIFGVSGDRVYGIFFDESRNPELAAFLNARDYSDMVGATGFVWTEEAGFRYLDDLFADQLLTAEQLQEGTTAGWLMVFGISGSSDEQMAGVGFWWDGDTVSQRGMLMSVSAVPEPAGYAALAGLALLAWAALRRRSGTRVTRG